MKLFLLLSFFLVILLDAKSSPLEHIRLQLQWKHQFEFAGFYAAKEQGYYKDVGLDVEFLEHGPSKTISQKVLDNDAEYGLVYSSVIAEAYNGKPLILLANFFKQSPIVLIAQKELVTPTDLVGKKIMGTSDTIDSITLLEMLKKFHITNDDYITVPATYTLESFINKKVDAMSVFITNELYTLDKLGINYNIFDPTVYGVKYYDLNLFTTQKEVKEHPHRVKAFRDASIKGWQYALSHKDEVVKLILKKYNSQNKDYNALMYEALQIEYIMLHNVYPVGSIDKKRIQSIVDSFKQADFIDKNIYKDVDTFIYKPAEEKFFLTPQEQVYLKNKKEIRICSDPDWMPLEAYIDGQYSGLNADVLHIFQTKFHLPLKNIQTKDWSESLQKVQDGSCDMLSLASKTKERSDYLQFTNSYLQLPIVILTRKETRSVVDIHKLMHVKLALVDGYVYQDIIQKNYKNLSIVKVKNKEEGIKKVLRGEVFGYVESSVVLEYYFKNHDFDGLKYNVQFDEKLDFPMAIKKTEPILYSIMQKAVVSFSEEDKKSIFQKWLYVQYEKVFDYSLFYKLLFLVVFLLLLMFYKQKSSSRRQRELQERIDEAVKESEHKSKMMYHQSKLVSMGEMMENIAHQWRQPLSQINSAVLILDDIASETKMADTLFEEKLLEIETLTAYMSKTISDFRDFYDQNKKHEYFTMDSVIDESIDILNGTLKKHNIALAVERGCDKNYYGLKNELKQVVVVILNNAKDAFLLDKTVNPKININLMHEEQKFIIEICDNAGGIDETSIEKIFEPYFSTKHKSQGTGLGLYISKLIVEESMHGKLKVLNQDAGVCFSIVLKEENE